MNTTRPASSGRCRVIHCQTALPSMSGKRRSRITTSYVSRLSDSTAAWPVAAATVRCPCSVRTSRNTRSEEHTSELQSHSDLVCRLLLEKKKKKKKERNRTTKKTQKKTQTKNNDSNKEDKKNLNIFDHINSTKPTRSTTASKSRRQVSRY